MSIPITELGFKYKFCACKSTKGYSSNVVHCVFHSMWSFFDLCRFYVWSFVSSFQSSFDEELFTWILLFSRNVLLILDQSAWPIQVQWVTNSKWMHNCSWSEAASSLPNSFAFCTFDCNHSWMNFQRYQCKHMDFQCELWAGFLWNHIKAAFLGKIIRLIMNQTIRIINMKFHSMLGFDASFFYFLSALK